MAKRKKTGKKPVKKTTKKITRKTAGKAAGKTDKKAGVKPGAKKKKNSSKRTSTKLPSVDHSWVETCLNSRTEEVRPGRCFVFEMGKVPKVLKSLLTASEVRRVDQLSSGEPFVFFGKIDGDLVVFPVKTQLKKSDLEGSLAAKVRQLMGRLYKQFENEDFDHIQMDIELKQKDVVKEVLVGLDLAHYRFSKRIEGASHSTFHPSLKVKASGRVVAGSVLKTAIGLSRGINLARHLVNLPPNQLQPEHYAKFVRQMFPKTPEVSVEVWEEARLKKERLNLLLAVGGASESAPRLVHIRYRPKGSSNKKPIALVGKGITFDSGGLDLKPPQYMRLMKKDMGGSAAVVGAVRYAALAGLKQPIDAYLALAENSISDEAFRPSDVIESRAGHMVEIDNTDAEGRLVLADALDVAVNKTEKEAPRYIIDVATLTGAIKVGLGRDIAGLFSNHRGLRDKLQRSGEDSGDLCWGMPLYRPYFSTLSNTPFADFQNSGEGFGGAITAALFLEKFTGEIPWAHLDIYSWNDSPKGCFLEKGGSGQGVSLLADFLEKA